MCEYRCELGKEQRADDECDSKLNTDCDLQVVV